MSENRTGTSFDDDLLCDAPLFCAPLKANHPSIQMRDALFLRRSTQADMLQEPGPSSQVLRDILTIGARVPDHRRVCPFRFILFQGQTRAKAGDILANVFAQNNADASQKAIDKEKNRFLRAPVIVGVVSNVDETHKTPKWEQVLSVGAVCQNILLASSAHGFAAQWLTEWYSYDRIVLEAFGLKSNEKIAGFIYIGSAKEDPKERQRPDIDALISSYT